MPSFWRNAGISYLEYSSICARLLRRALKPEARAEALKCEESAMKLTRWEQGKPAESRTINQLTQS